MIAIFDIGLGESDYQQQLLLPTSLCLAADTAKLIYFQKVLWKNVKYNYIGK